MTTNDDAVERAAEGVRRSMSTFGFVMPPESARVVARAALTAAADGEVAPGCATCGHSPLGPEHTEANHAYTEAPKPAADDYDPDGHPLQYAFDLVAHTLHRPGCNHHTGGPADCDSRAMTAVGALRDAGLLATPEHDAQVLRAFERYIDKRYDQIGEHDPSPVGYWEGYLDALDATSAEAGARADRIAAGEQP